MAEAEVATYSPATQSVQGAHEAAFKVSEKLPAAHALHVRSAIAEPGTTIYSPA